MSTLELRGLGVGESEMTITAESFVTAAVDRRVALQVSTTLVVSECGLTEAGHGLNNSGSNTHTCRPCHVCMAVQRARVKYCTVDMGLHDTKKKLKRSSNIEKQTLDHYNDDYDVT